MKEEIEVGDYIKIIQMDGEVDYTNKEGYVIYIDDFGQLHGTWGGVAINPKIDIIEVAKI